MFYANWIYCFLTPFNENKNIPNACTCTDATAILLPTSEIGHKAGLKKPEVNEIKTLSVTVFNRLKAICLYKEAINLQHKYSLPLWVDKYTDIDFLIVHQKH